MSYVDHYAVAGDDIPLKSESEPVHFLAKYLSFKHHKQLTKSYEIKY